ncbi:S-locus glycoprotein domain, partial [Sesbania bispinosa]
MGQSLGISDTMVSASGNIELGFFNRTRENSTKYYVGIWFKNVPNDKIMWVANRDYAFETSSAVLTIQSDGNIVIIDGPLTYSVSSVPNNSSTHALLLDSGNLILLNYSNDLILWQSFDNPTDTLVQGMLVGQEFILKSWKSAEDPAPGAFSLVYDFHNASLIVHKGSNVFFVDNSASINRVLHRLDSDRNRNRNKDFIIWPGDSNSRVVLEVSGDLNYQKWSEKAKRWVSLQSSKCGTNNSCGDFSICNPQLEALEPCHCLDGFEPLDADSWRQRNRSGGCVRRKELSCSKTNVEWDDRFLQLSMVELPSTSSEVMLKMDTAARCERTCFNDCSCVAYAYDFNSYCWLWHDHLFGLKNVSGDVENVNNTWFYLRLAASEIAIIDSNIRNALGRHENRKRSLLLFVIPIAFLILHILGLFVYWTKRQRKGEDLLHFDVRMGMNVKDTEFTERDKGLKVKKKEVKLPLFSFGSVSAATNNFSDANKLALSNQQTGKLLNGDEVAVKRLSRRSGQGWEELRNEALLIAKLQHNNLSQKSPKYAPFYLTQTLVVTSLSMSSRCNKKKDARLGNTDFGMARIFGENELQANTNRIVGTYGYMSPEYALEGLFSIKSDVFSFGVLLLEIVSGKKNTGFYQTNSLNLLAY